MGIFHPSVEEVAASHGEFLYPGLQRLPGAVAHAVGLLGILNDKSASLCHVARMLDGVLILLHQVAVACHALHGNLYLFHDFIVWGKDKTFYQEISLSL